VFPSVAMSSSNVNHDCHGLSRTMTVTEVLPSQRFCVEGKNSTRDQICPAIALLEIEHKQFPLGKIFKLRSEKGNQ